MRKIEEHFLHGINGTKMRNNGLNNIFRSSKVIFHSSSSGWQFFSAAHPSTRSACKSMSIKATWVFICYWILSPLMPLCTASSMECCSKPHSHSVYFRAATGRCLSWVDLTKFTMPCAVWLTQGTHKPLIYSVNVYRPLMLLFCQGCALHSLSFSASHLVYVNGKHT